MSNRSAVDTIRGYFYQFDHSILQLLRLSGGLDSIDIEGIEDIDINTANETTAIQCKYYAKTEYNHSVIGRPIRFMLSDYKNRKGSGRPSVRYRIYGKYESGQEKLILPLSADFLRKHFLTYKEKEIQHYHHNELGLTDDGLDEFIGLLTIDINAKPYEEQYQDVLSEIRSCFSCSDFEAEHYYYNNALSVVRSLSTQPNVHDRRIKKADFISRIDKKELLFNEWFIDLKGRKEYIREIKKQYFTLALNTSPFERFFLIEASNVNYDRAKLKTLLLLIQKKWSKLSQRESQSFCPYVYLHNIPTEELVGIKTNLRDEGYFCEDGFDFEGALFSAKSLCRQATFHNGIKLKFINDLDQLPHALDAITNTKEIYQFYIDRPFFETENAAIKHVKVQVKILQDVEEIIK